MRFLRSPAHLGPHAGVSSARALRRPRRSDQRGSPQWLSSRADFFIPVAASKIYRAKFHDAMHQAGLLDQIPRVWREAWVVHSQAVGDGRLAVRSRAVYLPRGHQRPRIKALDDGPEGQGQVTFAYRRVARTAGGR